jgi:predicted nucleic acid-binding protein
MRSVSPRFFVDTNVLVYAYDAKDVLKRDRAIEVLSILGEKDLGAISVQVLSEFFRAVTRPNRLILSPELARARIERYSRSWTVFDLRPINVLEAMRGVREHKLSYYDALIWATARLNGMPYLLSEDGQEGRYLEGVRILNPLSADFDLASLK